ncbi:MAG: TSUP family transporter [Desulfovibrio sp.]|nr:TSUP family transporter [Desulfovibrio sp.]
MVSLGLIIFASLAAFIAGFIDAIAGGGGLIVLPCLLLTGLSPYQALSCNKFSACLGTAQALRSFTATGLVRWDIALKGIAFSLIGAAAGSLLALHIEQTLLGKILVALLPFALILTLLPHPHPKNDAVVSFWKIAPICLAIGLYDGFFGPGTGSFLILAFHWLMGLELLNASATAKTFNLASNLASTLTFISQGTMLWPLALPMAFGSILGNTFGSRLAIKKGNESVRRFLTFSLFLLIISLLIKYFF